MAPLALFRQRSLTVSENHSEGKTTRVIAKYHREIEPTVSWLDSMVPPVTRAYFLSLSDGRQMVVTRDEYYHYEVGDEFTATEPEPEDSFLGCWLLGAVLASGILIIVILVLYLAR